MLARYQIPMYRKIALPDGIRKDIRKHTNHCLSPTKKIVMEFFKDPSEESWKKLEEDYLKLLETNFKTRREEFDDLAELAAENDVFIGCNCPTKKNPDVYRCHTVLALKFMKEKYPNLKVKFPSKTSK